MPINRAPWNALVDDNGTNTTGSPWNKAAIATVLLDPIDAAIGTWITYAVTWANTGSANALGNGSLVGRYQLPGAGKTMLIQIRLAFGSGTVSGSGAWVFGLPFAADDSYVQPVMVSITDNDFGYRIGAGQLYGGGSQIVPYGSGAPNGIFSTLPMTWTAGDVLEINGTLKIK